MNVKVIAGAMVALGGIVMIAQVSADSNHLPGEASNVAPHDAPEGGIGPDVTTLYYGGAPGAPSMWFYGTVDDIAAYSLATTSCNEGDVPVDWYASTNQHPVIAQNMFRLKDGRFEQIGMSWLKHGFCAVNQPGCGTCQDTNCDTLGLGCSDTYGATTNGRFEYLGPRSELNAATGFHPEPHGSPTGETTLRGRLQVHVADLEPANPDALYFGDAHYVSEHDTTAGNEDNNASWRKLIVAATLHLSPDGDTVRHEPALYAWQLYDVGVNIALVDVPEDGRFILGSKVTDLGGGFYRYDYALTNYNSDRSAQAFIVDVPTSADISDIYFHDVDYHSGEPYDLTDWPGVFSAGACTWSTESFDDNPDANALRFGTTYTYSFTADVAPVMGSLQITLFKPGADTAAFVAGWTPANVNTALPTSFDVVFGEYQGGSLQDLHDSDDSYLTIEQRPAFSPLFPLIRVEVDATTTVLDPAQLTFIMEASADALPPTVPQRIRLFDYDATTWSTVDERTATLADSVVELDFTINPGRFVEDGTGNLSARLEWFNPGNVFSPNWGADIDLVNWELQ